MGIWTNKERRTAFDDAEGLAYGPSGDRVKMWLVGIGIALIPFIYGVYCLVIGKARLFGQHNSALDLDGPAAMALAIAYIAVGMLIHAHWFWGLHPRLFVFSPALKLVAVLVFLGSLGFILVKILQ